jgi:hypothetical protein
MEDLEVAATAGCGEAAALWARTRGYVVQWSRQVGEIHGGPRCLGGGVRGRGRGKMIRCAPGGDESRMQSKSAYICTVRPAASGQPGASGLPAASGLLAVTCIERGERRGAAPSGVLRMGSTRCACGSSTRHDSTDDLTDNQITGGNARTPQVSTRMQGPVGAFCRTRTARNAFQWDLYTAATPLPILYRIRASRRPDVPNTRQPSQEVRAKVASVIRTPPPVARLPLQSS